MKISLQLMHRKTSGFSVVEMMIAMTVGLVLVGGIMEIFLSSRTTNSLQMSIAKIQQNGRMAINTLTTEIRMADYSGCYHELGSSLENTLNSATAFAWNLSSTIQGFNDVSSSFNISDSASGGVISGLVEDTDVLVIKGMTDGVPLKTNPDNATFTIDEPLNRFKKGELLVVADCQKASMFQASSVSNNSGVTTILHAGSSMTPGNSTGTVSNSYGTNAEIAKLNSTIYYIKNDATGIPGLFQASLTVNSAGSVASLVENQLVSHVQNMQFQYGVDTDNDSDADVYQDADSVADWDAVISIRVALLMISESQTLAETKESYSFDSSAFTFTKDTTPSANADRRLKREFSGFMAIRNRTLS